MKQRQVSERLCAAQGRWTVGAPPWILCEYSKLSGRYGHTFRQLGDSMTHENTMEGRAFFYPL